MAFLSSKTLKKRIPNDEIIIPYKEERIKYAAYELSMGREAYVTTDEKKKKYEDDDQVVIHPGQFALLITEETIKVPTNLIAFISIKFAKKSEGLINVSGFHVDPGFEGKLKFSVYNAGAQNVILEVGVPTFQIWFSKTTERVEKYDGSHNGQNSISADDVRKVQGKLASPNELKNRIDKLEDTFKTLKALAQAILVALIIVFVRGCSSDHYDLTPQDNSNQEKITAPLKTDQDSL